MTAVVPDRTFGAVLLVASIAVVPFWLRYWSVVRWLAFRERARPDDRAFPDRFQALFAVGGPVGVLVLDGVAAYAVVTGALPDIPPQTVGGTAAIAAGVVGLEIVAAVTALSPNHWGNALALMAYTRANRALVRQACRSLARVGSRITAQSSMAFARLEESASPTRARVRMDIDRDMQQIWNDLNAAGLPQRHRKQLARAWSRALDRERRLAFALGGDSSSSLEWLLKYPTRDSTTGVRAGERETARHRQDC